jgi:ABC-type sulfate transport system substrate-binding protein
MVRQSSGGRRSSTVKVVLGMEADIGEGLAAVDIDRSNNKPLLPATAQQRRRCG